MANKPTTKNPKTHKMKGYADIGSHNKIFMFSAGSVAEKYPTLLHIYAEKVSPDLIPVTITFKTT